MDTRIDEIEKKLINLKFEMNKITKSEKKEIIEEKINHIKNLYNEEFDNERNIELKIECLEKEFNDIFLKILNLTNDKNILVDMNIRLEKIHNIIEKQKINLDKLYDMIKNNNFKFENNIKNLNIEIKNNESNLDHNYKKIDEINKEIKFLNEKENNISKQIKLYKEKYKKSRDRSFELYEKISLMREIYEDDYDDDVDE